MMLPMLAFFGFIGHNADLWVSDGCGQAKTGATGDYIGEHLAMTACGHAKTSCEAMCRANPRCLAWQWMNPSPSNTTSATCYLKGSPGLAPNGASTAGVVARPAPTPPPPPVPPPPRYATKVRVDAKARRATVRYGYGNELCFQSLNDTVLNAAIASSGGTVGRYPGGTPSDYWHWDTGWATDLEGYAGPRPATPTTWAKYAKLY